MRHNPRWDLHKSAQPRWSPDGRWVVFTSFKGVYRMHPDGSALELIAPKAWSPAWSPDGKMIVYAACRSDDGCSAHRDGPVLFHLYVSYPDGGGETQLTHDTATLAYSDVYWVN